MRAQEGQAQENPESTGGGPTGPGWVIQIVAHHFHNEDRHRPEEGEQFVRGTIVKNLNGEGVPITITVGPKAGSQVSVEELGIGFPVIVRSEPLRKVFVSQTAPGGAPGGAGVAGAIPDLAGSGVPGTNNWNSSVTISCCSSCGSRSRLHTSRSLPHSSRLPAAVDSDLR